jgi:hypothetical protein
VLLAALAAPLWASTADPEWHVRNWQTDDGLPDANVTAIQQTPDGFLWVGTPKGLARFDGVHFKVFDSERFPALVDPRISALLVDRRGTLWIGTWSGHLVRYEDGRFRTLKLSDPSGLTPVGGFMQEGRVKGVTSTLVEDGAGGVWWLLANGAGLLRCQGEEMTRCTSTNGLPPGKLVGGVR